MTSKKAPAMAQVASGRCNGRTITPAVASAAMRSVAAVMRDAGR
ncbi:MAG: hypothetical protein ACREC1_09315 [Methylovirgula sp.]